MRTLSTEDTGFNPIGYHTGTVWPHDNSLIAAGLARYGYRAEANRIIADLLEAAESFGYRLPEAFAGYARERRGTPTIMIGRAEDPEFDRHLAEGPYITIDDVAADRYKLDLRVQHIPGHPVCDQMYRELLRALGVELPGMTAMALMKVFVNLRSELKY